MTSVFQRISAWYRNPDQEFLRREMRRSLQWMRFGPGRYWIGAYALVVIVQAIAMSNIRLSTTGYGTFRSTLVDTLRYGGLFLIPQILALCAWLIALQERTFAPLSRDRADDLMLTALRPRDLWPALLLTPFLLWMTFAVIGNVASFGAFAHWLITSGPPGDDDPRVWFAYRIYQLVVGLAIVAAQTAATTAWAARWIHPGGSGTRIVVRGLLAVLLFNFINTTAIYLSQVFFMGMKNLFLAPTVRDIWSPLPYHIAFLPGVIFRIALFAWLFRLAVRRLRSDRTAEVWRRWAEE